MVIQTYSEAIFMKNKKKDGARHTSVTLLLATLTHAAVFAACILLGSLILFNGQNPTSLVGTASLLSFIIGGAISGFCVSRALGRHGFSLSAASALIFTLILLIISAVLSNGKVSPRALMNYLCYLPTAMLFAFIATRRKVSRKKRRRR